MDHAGMESTRPLNYQVWILYVVYNNNIKIMYVGAKNYGSNEFSY